MNLDEAAQVMRYIEGAWPRNITEGTAAAYIDGIMDLPFGEAKQAVRDLARTSKFMPSIAEIRERVAADVGLLPPSVNDALRQARALLDYKEQAQWANGSGWRPLPPTVHPAVEASCRSIHPDNPRWAEAFRANYRSEAQVAQDGALVGQREGLLGLGGGE